MDRSTDWPWSWREEIEWKADLEERDYDFLQQQIDIAVADSITKLGYMPDSLPQNFSEDDSSEKYSVTV